MYEVEEQVILFTIPCGETWLKKRFVPCDHTLPQKITKKNEAKGITSQATSVVQTKCCGALADAGSLACMSF